MKNSGLPTGSGLRCCPSTRSWSTIGRKAGSSSQPSYSPSISDANRQTTIATRRPPGRSTRRASARAFRRSAAPVRWYSGPNSNTASSDWSGSDSSRASPTTAVNAAAGSLAAAWRACSTCSCTGSTSCTRYPARPAARRRCPGHRPHRAAARAARAAAGPATPSTGQIPATACRQGTGANAHSQSRNDFRSPDQSPLQTAAKTLSTATGIQLRPSGQPTLSSRRVHALRTHGLGRPAAPGPAGPPGPRRAPGPAPGHPSVRVTAAPTPAGSTRARGPRGIAGSLRWYPASGRSSSGSTAAGRRPTARTSADISASLVVGLAIRPTPEWVICVARRAHDLRRTWSALGATDHRTGWAPALQDPARQ